MAQSSRFGAALAADETASDRRTRQRLVPECPSSNGESCSDWRLNKFSLSGLSWEVFLLSSALQLSQSGTNVADVKAVVMVNVSYNRSSEHWLPDQVIRQNHPPPWASTQTPTSVLLASLRAQLLRQLRSRRVRLKLRSPLPQQTAKLAARPSQLEPRLLLQEVQHS